MNKSRETFGSQFGVIMAMAGSAIGLGNIWRFPYIVGQYGGAAFIIVYIVASLVLALPIFYAESIIGRLSRSNVYGAMKSLTPGTGWHLVSFVTIVTPIIILGFYSVVGGWSIQYLYKSLSFSFINESSGDISNYFDSYIVSEWLPLIGLFLFILSILIITLSGVKNGIEKFSKPTLPILLIIIIAVVIYSLSLPGAQQGVDYLFKPDFSKLTAQGVVAALGQSFFSLSLGLGTILVYASYMKKNQDIVKSGLGTALFDIIFAIMASLAVMPAIFAAELTPSDGPGLIFKAIPYIFNQMGQTIPIISGTMSILFFFTIFLAALTSAVSLIEVGVAFLSEQTNLTRKSATYILSGIIFILGVICSLSFGVLSDVIIFGDNIFGFLDTVSSDILLPFGGLLFTIYVGWKLPKSKVYDEFTNSGTIKFNKRLFPIFRFLIRYVAPIGIILIWLGIL